MKISWKKAAVLLLCAALCCSLTAAALAHDVPDMSRLCSVTVTMRLLGAPVPGGTLSIYRVGEVAEDNGDYSFRPTGDFAACGESFADLTDSDLLALRLMNYGSILTPLATQTIDANGQVRFTDLPVGLYLMVQKTPAPGYAKMSPFLVSLPYLENGSYCYDLTATPKTDLDRTPPPTPTPPPSLPPTGQLWWPVPLLLCGGLLLCAVGGLVGRKKGLDED